MSEFSRPPFKGALSSEGRDQPDPFRLVFKFVHIASGQLQLHPQASAVLRRWAGFTLRADSAPAARTGMARPVLGGPGVPRAQLPVAVLSLEGSRAVAQVLRHWRVKQHSAETHKASRRAPPRSYQVLPILAASASPKARLSGFEHCLDRKPGHVE